MNEISYASCTVPKIAVSQDHNLHELKIGTQDKIW